jgi:cobalt-zinc-cadmium efflux system outer membrane protein
MVFMASLLILFILGSSLAVRAEDHLTLHTALDTASQRNLTLQAARKDISILEGRTLQAGAIPNPEIGGSLYAIPFNGAREGSKHEFEIGQTVELWGKRSLRRRSATSDLEALRLQYRGLSLDLRRQVKESYWGLSLAQHRGVFAEENLRFQQRFLARVQDRFQSGQVKLPDVARAKLEVARASNELLVAQKQLKQGEAELNRLMGQDIRQAMASPEQLSESLVEVNEDKLMEQALANRTERQSLGALKRGATADQQLANRLLWAPDLKTGLIYQKGEREDGRGSWGGRLGFVFPLWYRYSGERQAATARLDSLSVQGQNIDQTILLEVHQSFLELNLASEQIKLWKQAVDQALEAARLAEQQYLEGNADLLVFFQARRELVAATLEYLQALRNYQANLAELERAVGTEIAEAK